MTIATRENPRLENPTQEAASLILQLHHRRIDELLERIAIAVELASWSEARALFIRFRAELEEHIRIEEQTMFPSFEAFMRGGAGPTLVMRTEHAEISRRMDALEDLLSAEQGGDEPLEALRTLLASHNAKEEQVLYPTFERHAPPEAYGALIRELGPLFEK